MSKRARITTALLLATLIGGCVPIPIVYYYMPAVSGVILQNGSPVAGAEVRVSDQFVDEDRVATTGTDGRFATEPIREFSFVRPLLRGDQISECLVEITAGGKTYKGYHDGGTGHVPETLELRCDLSLSPALDGARAYCVPERKGAAHLQKRLVPTKHSPEGRPVKKTPPLPNTKCS
jgi:hypothetical protein